mgnify:CR=1 FL=1
MWKTCKTYGLCGKTILKNIIIELLEKDLSKLKEIIKSDEELKEHHEKVVKIYKSFIEEDTSIKEYIQNSKSLIILSSYFIVSCFSIK